MIFGISLLVFFWEPIPPNTTGIAVGRQGTSDGIYGEKLAAFFCGTWRQAKYHLYRGW
jgi:hypothetical protein